MSCMNRDCPPCPVGLGCYQARQKDTASAGTVPKLCHFRQVVTVLSLASSPSSWSIPAEAEWTLAGWPMGAASCWFEPARRGQHSLSRVCSGTDCPKTVELSKPHHRCILCLLDNVIGASRSLFGPF